MPLRPRPKRPILNQDFREVSMNFEQMAGTGAVYLAIAVFIIIAIFKAVRIVPQSEKYVV